MRSFIYRIPSVVWVNDPMLHNGFLMVWYYFSTMLLRFRISTIASQKICKCLWENAFMWVSKWSSLTKKNLLRIRRCWLFGLVLNISNVILCWYSGADYCFVIENNPNKQQEKSLQSWSKLVQSVAFRTWDFDFKSKLVFIQGTYYLLDILGKDITLQVIAVYN